MRSIILLISSFQLAIFFPAFAQQDFLVKDYQNFGRKEPASLGSWFSALGTGTILVNPANIALVTDNRINIGGVVSDIGQGSFISWMAPNFGISSANQKVALNDTSGVDHKKQLLHFNFGLSTRDLGQKDSERELAVGIAIKRQADRLMINNDESISGGSAVSVDIGLLFNWKRVTFEFAVIDVNNPRLSETEMKYGRGFLVGGRFSTPTGLSIALQGIGGNMYAGSDFGLNFGAEQSFLEHRLVTRLQLTSFFSGAEATMQNISSCIGYRFSPGLSLPMFFKDLEFCYALSFLSMPKNVGTHMMVLTKYF